MRVEMKVAEVLPLKNDVFQVFLKSNVPLNYSAGQYLEVVLLDKNVPLSIANAGGKIPPSPPFSKGEIRASKVVDSVIELHIRHTPGHPTSDALMQALQLNQVILVNLPLGNSTINCLSPSLPTILMARGTGFSPIKAVLEAMFQKNWQAPIHLYWGVRLSDDHYLDVTPKAWAAEKPYFKYTPLICPEESDALISQVTTDYPDLSACQIMAAGPFNLMFKARDEWAHNGLVKTRMYSDAFGE